jgi:hypothetical protein
MKKLVLLALGITVLFVSTYAAYTLWLNPHPDAAAANAASPSNGASPTDASGAMPNPTIVTAQLNKDGVPEQIGTLTLKTWTRGKDALAEFEAMHGKSFDLKDGYRADYVDGSASATLWVGQAQSADAAQTLAQEMADQIKAGNPMFTNLQELSIANRTLYEVNGQGQLHFFYASNDKLVWLATDSDHAADALHSLWGAVQ